MDHGDKVDVAPGKHLLDKLGELLPVLLLALQPRSMEVQAKRRPVTVEVPVEVVPEQPSELFSGLNIGAGVHHVTTRQRLVESRVVPSVQFIHHHLPDGMGPRWTVSAVSITLMGHSEVQSVRPDGYTTQGSSDRGIVDEELVSHHLELLVATHAKIRGPHSDDGTIGNVGESLDNQSGTCHLGQPVVVGSLGPVLRVVLVCQ